jgi:hypothetical protein
LIGAILRADLKILDIKLSHCFRAFYISTLMRSVGIAVAQLRPMGFDWPDCPSFSGNGVQKLLC